MCLVTYDSEGSDPVVYVNRPWKPVSLPVAETSRVPATLEIRQHTVNIGSNRGNAVVVVLVALDLIGTC